MPWLVRLLLFLPVIFLIALVYAGQRHDNARDILHSSLRISLKSTIYLVLLVVVMQLLHAIFV